MKTIKGNSILWSKIKANFWALFHMQQVYTEMKKDEYGIHFYTTFVATCTGSMKGEDLEIKKVFYERVEQ
jgi:hypothetical protein